MLQKNEQGALSMSPYSDLFDILIEKDNFWRLMNESIDFSFIYDEVEHAYSQTMGRPAESPIIMFKYILLKVKFKLSDRDLIARTKTDMLFKYFLGYDPESLTFIDPSSLSKFRRLRLVDTNLLDVLIQKTVELALEENIVIPKTRLIMDSTHTNAMFQHISPREELINRAKALRKVVYEVDKTMAEQMPRKRESTGLLEDQISYSKELIEKVKSSETCMYVESVKERLNYLEEGIEDTEMELEYSKEPDARVGHKTADTSFFGFKTHLAMTPERIITVATITSGEKHDGKELRPLVEKTKKSGLEIEAVIGDGAYSEAENLAYAKAEQFELASKLSKSITHGNGKNKEKFSYNKDANMYVCEAGHMAIRKVMSGSKCDSKGINTQVESYFFDVENCKTCPFKNGCYQDGAKSKSFSIKIKQDIHIDHMEYMETERFKELYDERYKIEAKNGELKTRYGYSAAQGCGLLGMTIQAASTIFLTNMKRIIKLKTQKNESIQ